MHLNDWERAQKTATLMAFYSGVVAVVKVCRNRPKVQFLFMVPLWGIALIHFISLCIFLTGLVNLCIDECVLLSQKNY